MTTTFLPGSQAWLGNPLEAKLGGQWRSQAQPGNDIIGSKYYKPNLSANACLNKNPPFFISLS
jgi:hypothetical protein